MALFTEFVQQACSCNYLATSCADLKLPPDGNTMSGWVRVTFQAGGQEITVGNESAPGLNNHSCIKDFEFGHSNGCECRITIHDEQGSSYVVFMENILKDMKDANGITGTTMKVEFGWVTVDCESLVPQVRTSPSYYFMMRDIQCNFAGGKFMYIITGYDITEVSFEGRLDKIFGGDGTVYELHLVEAIRKLFTESEPSVSSVRFLVRPECQILPSGEVVIGSPTNVQFERGDPFLGPTGKWACKNMSKLDIAKDWLKGYVTKNGKALKPAYNSEVEGGEIIFWEDTNPACGENVLWDKYSIGKYVVNGGSTSSVLEFNPKFKWNFSTMTNPGGAAGSGRPLANLHGGKNPGLVGCPSLDREQQPTAGSQTNPAAGEQLQNTEGLANADAQAQRGAALQMKAFHLFRQSVEGELVILGDEQLIRPSLCLYRNVQIVFIDPFFIFESNDLQCGEWLASPACNPVLSNKAWQVRSITHRIQDGKFTTSLNIFLSNPGIDINDGSPLGGYGSCGWTPPANLGGNSLRGVVVGFSGPPPGLE